MRILMLNYEYPPLGGGGGVAAANLAQELVRRGHVIDYVSSYFPGLARQETDRGVAVYREKVVGRTGLQTASIISMLSYPAVAFYRARQLHRRKPYDLVHTHFAIPTGPVGYLMSKYGGLPNVLSVYGGDIYDPSKNYSPHRHPVLKAAVKCILNQADIVIPESNDLCVRVKATYGTNTAIRRIPIGFVSPKFCWKARDKLGLDSEAAYAVAVSRLIPRKDYPTLIRAFHACGADNLRLLIIGDGPEESRLCALASNLGIADRIHFLGYRTEEEKFQYLSVADFFVLASLHEGFGIVFQEAMHCGLPIATTNIGGQNDFLTEGENALLVPPRDVQALSECIGRLASDRELRHRMADSNRKRLENMLIEQVAAEYEQLYETLLAE